MIFEDIALAVAPTVPEADRLRFLASLDSLPVAHRSLIGTFLLGAMNQAHSEPDDATVWRFRRIASSEGEYPVQLAFAVRSKEHEQMIQDLFSWWLQLRHHDFCEAVGGGEAVTTVGVLITPRQDGVRPWDTTMIATAGDLGLEDAELAALRRAWDDADDTPLVT
jgi:hypothetical protein